MRGLVFHGVGDVRMEDVPDAHVVEPTDAVVQTVAACVCGSDLWWYRDTSTKAPGSRCGHELIGTVTEVGAEVRDIRPGDFVIVPFCYSCGFCPECRAGITSACRNGGAIGGANGDGGQGEAVRVPWADGSLKVVPGGRPADDAMLASLLTLADVFPTGHHAAVAAGVRPGSTVAVVGDGAVGLLGVLAAARLGAKRIIALSRHADRQALARRFGATDIVAERGREATAAVRDLTDGVGADAVLECVGLDEAMQTAFRIARAGADVGYVGVPHGVQVPVGYNFSRNIGLRGGVAPVRTYLDELLPVVLEGTVQPGLVLDLRLPFENLAEGYAAMTERRAIKAWAVAS
jgi:threonine dehydrogenase-like Zn-dependent dehydrogenase